MSDTNQPFCHRGGLAMDGTGKRCPRCQGRGIVKPERESAMSDHAQAIYDVLANAPVSNFTSLLGPNEREEIKRHADALAAERLSPNGDLRERIRRAIYDAIVVKRTGHLFPLRDPNNLPSFDEYTEQQLEICGLAADAVRAALGPAVPVELVLEYVDRRNEWDQSLIDNNRQAVAIRAFEEVALRLNAAIAAATEGDR